MANKITYFIEYFKHLDNPIECLLFKFGLKENCVIKSKDYNKTFEISKIPEIDMIMYCLGSNRMIDSDGAFDFIDEVISGKEIINWENIKILNEKADIFIENYLKGSYKEINVNYKNRDVIDIGANIGDTALLFAKNGATVYGFEPVKELCKIAEKNIELNKDLKDKIHILNFGVSDKRGKLNIKEMNSTSAYADENDSYTVDIITLDDILNKYDVKPDILKIDCEGCEFGIIENSDLSKFKDIIFEHHARMVDSDYEVLIEKLKSEGFKIDLYQYVGFDIKEQGIVHAYKN